MVRTFALAGLVTLFGVTSSQAQYTDSAPPNEYESDAPYDGYDYELLGDPQDYGNGERGYSEPDIDVGIFASLGSQGRWFVTANFGWVWRPYAAAGWRPYSQGHWVWTSHGWTWVSYEPFGWAAYHYGFWTFDAALGWVWIPDYEWSACRVEWAYCDSYISWAPLPPPGYYCPRPWTSAGFSVWFTVGASHFCDPYPTRYCVTSRYKSVYRERVAFKSPDRYHVERYRGAPIQTSTVSFKHTKWSKGETGAARYSGGATYSGGANSSKRSSSKTDWVATNSKTRKSDARGWNAPEGSGRTKQRAVKPQTRKPDEGQFSANSRRVASTTWQSATRKQDTRTTRDIVETKKGVSGKEWRMARAERRSQIQMDRRAPREERVVRQSTRTTHSKQSVSKKSVQTRAYSSEPRKSVASGEKSSGRESNSVPRWESGSRGQGKGKMK